MEEQWTYLSLDLDHQIRLQDCDSQISSKSANKQPKRESFVGLTGLLFCKTLKLEIITW